MNPAMKYQPPTKATLRELLDRLLHHGVGEAGMMALRPRPHLDADHRRGQDGGDRPADEEGQGMRARIVEHKDLQQRSDQRHRRGRRDGARPIALKRRAGRDLVADRKNIRQRLVEIGHSPFPPRVHFVMQSIARRQRKSKSAPAGLLLHAPVAC